MNDTTLMFVNGTGMKGGDLNDALTSGRFVGEVSTAPEYRFFSVRDEFPGLYPAKDGEGSSIKGELYEVSWASLREKLLPREPEELELSVIKLSDGHGCLSMRMRTEALAADGVEEITRFGGWRAYQAESRASGDH